MTGLNNSGVFDTFDESCNLLLQISPPQYVEKVSRYLASSNGQNEVSCNPTEEYSDSGDSLFITQKPAPLPVRSSTTRYNRGSYPTPPTDLAESEDDLRSSASHGVSKTDKRKKKLPAYSFPFLAERKSKRRSKHSQSLHNKILHNSAMGGFFKCVQKMWHGYGSRDVVDSSLPTVDSSLPTVDMETDPISPLSEEEEEGSGNEDIKVVERNVFAVPLKRKSQQTFCKQLTRKKQRKATNTRQETSQGEQCKTSQLPAKATLSRSTSELVDTMNCDSEESACRVKAEAHKTKGLLVGEKKKKNAREGKTWGESEVDNPQKSQLRHKEDGKEAAATVTEPQTEVLHIDDLPQTAQFKTLHSPAGRTSDTHTDLLCEETMAKKKKKDKDRSRSQEEVQGMNVTERPLNEDSMLRQEEGDTSDLKEKKRKKREAAAENVNNLGFDLRVEVSSLSTENGGKKKKSKRRDNEEEQRQSSAVPEPFNDNAEMQKKHKKHKKRRKEEGIVVAEEGNCLAASEQTLESSFVKRKKHKKKKHSSSKEASQHGRSSPVECVDGSSVNDAVETSPKKTKKKKTLIEGVDNSSDSEEKKKVLNEDDILKTVEGLADQNAEVRVRKKKKKKRSEDNMVQSGDSMSVQDKSSSILCADPESSLKAYVWGAEKPGVSAGNLEAESEEVSGNLEISNNEDRKKKRKGKRKMLEVQNGVGKKS
nr:biorientation of chromosomes in cell division protein 1-like 1 [Labrus bergylta]